MRDPGGRPRYGSTVPGCGIWMLSKYGPPTHEAQWVCTHHLTIDGTLVHVASWDPGIGDTAAVWSEDIFVEQGNSAQRRDCRALESLIDEWRSLQTPVSDEEVRAAREATKRLLDRLIHGPD